MNPKFSIDFDWLSREFGTLIDRSTLAEISIRMGSGLLTELEDVTSKTIRKGTRVSAYQLAFWLANNWWRLCHEPEKEDMDWRMSHDMAAVGGGYLWPNIVFSSDGALVFVQSRAVSHAGHTIRYLNNFNDSVSIGDFELGLSDFIEAVLERLDSMGAKNSGLVHLWGEVWNERRDPELTRQRILEACLGFDPAEAPQPLVDGLFRAGRLHGQEAVQEIAAASGEQSLSLMELLWKNVRTSSEQIHISECGALRLEVEKAGDAFSMPWQKAESAAALVRKKWSVRSGPLSTARFAEILHVSESFIREGEVESNIPVHAGFRNGSGLETLKVFVNKRPVTSRRFALARLLGDHLIASMDDTLLPATRMSTQRQKFQRAFAQELLCPHSELTDFFEGTGPDDESIEDAATHFEVSPLLVRSALVNKGILDRGSLAGAISG